MIRSVIYSIAALGVMVFALPPIASAQSASCGWFWNTNTAACGTGSLLVYLQVMNPDTVKYVPSNFIVEVNGQNPSLHTFPGSLQGTLVTLTSGGTYNVTVPQPLDFVASYSQGCSGTMYSDTKATCVITMSGYRVFSQNSILSPYASQRIPLSCAPQLQNTIPGKTTTFIASGGSGTYNWSTIDRTSLNVGPVFNTTFQNTGTQAVTVTSNAQTAVCTVNVSSTGGPILYGLPSNINTVVPGYAYTGGVAASPSAVTYGFSPSLPNTGLEPMTSVQIAFALVLLLGAGIFFAPYIRHGVSSLNS